MASKGGYRPEGSDGSDHWHRESIAWQYKLSSINKWRLKFTIVLQFMIGFLMLARLMPGICNALGLVVLRLRRLDLPHPRPWEYAWMVSLFASALGWKSMAQNNSFLLRQFVFGTCIFGLAPVMFGTYDLSGDISAYFNTRDYTYVMLGVPAILLWCGFMVIAIQIHLFSLYFSYVLLNAWRPRGVDKSKSK